MSCITECTLHFLQSQMLVIELLQQNCFLQFCAAQIVSFNFACKLVLLLSGSKRGFCCYLNASLPFTDMSRSLLCDPSVCWEHACLEPPPAWLIHAPPAFFFLPVLHHRSSLCAGCLLICCSASFLWMQYCRNILHRRKCSGNNVVDGRSCKT